MQAAILAAGKSTRMHPLTLTRPKPMLKIANKTILEYNLDNLSGIVNEAIIVVGYKKEMIKRFLGARYGNIRIKYAEQKQQLGTGHAVSLLEPHIKGRFILMMGDDIYSRKDMLRCIRHKYSILTAKTKNPEKYGVIVQKMGILAGFMEKPKRFVSDTISTALYVLDEEIFQYIKRIKKSKRNEYELPDAIKLLAKQHKIHCISSSQWLPAGFPIDLLKADRILRHGKNYIGKNTKIIGSVKNSSVGNNCFVSGKVKNSIIMDDAIIGEKSDINESIVGQSSYFQGRASKAVIADNVKASNIIAEGCKILPGKTLSNKKLKEDIA